MSLDVQKLQDLYKRDAVSRAIIETLKEEGAAQVPEVAELDGGYVNVPAFAKLDARGRTMEIIRALKALHKTGCGTFIAGGGGGRSRMSWELEPEEIYAFATGGGEPLVEVDVAVLARFPNLEACIRSSAAAKPWPAPVLAAARAGLWEADVSARKWRARLDALERALEGVRRA